MPSEHSQRFVGSSPRTVSTVLVLLIAQSVLAPTAAAVPEDRQPRECVATEPAEPGGIPVTVERGPVENSVTLSISRGQVLRVQDSLWGIELPSGTEFHSTSGFEEDPDRDRLYRPTKNVRNYSLTYTYEEDGTLEGTSANGVARPFEGDDDWAIAPLPRNYNGRVSYQTPEQAVLGQQTVYFGDYTMTTVANGCHRIRLVVPESMDVDRNQTAILDSLQYADRHMGGQRYDEVTIFVTPETFESYGGVARASDTVISTRRALPENDARTPIWLHEYIHTRQTYEPGGDFEWWTEASATYLSMRMGLRSGYFSPSRYNAVLSFYGENETGDAVLANESTWQNWSTYKRGALALVQLDATLREETNGSVTVVSVFNATERHRPQTHAAFLGLLENRTGSRYDEWSEHYVRGTATGELTMKAEPSARDWLAERNLFVIGLGTLAILVLVADLLRGGDSNTEEGDDQ